MTEKHENYKGNFGVVEPYNRYSLTSLLNNLNVFQFNDTFSPSRSSKNVDLAFNSIFLLLDVNFLPSYVL